MTVRLFFRSVLLWLLIALLAIANGVFRDNVLIPLVGKNFALPMSGLSLSVIVFVMTWLFFPLIHSADKSAYIFVGATWVLLTLLFEFFFGHYVIDKSWSDIIQIFNVSKGDLFLVALVTTLVSPLLVAIMRGK